MFGAAIEGGSLNIGMRERQQNDIVVANHKLVKRIQMCKPTYDRKEDDGRGQEPATPTMYNRPAVANRPRSSTPRRRAECAGRPASAGAALTTKARRPRLRRRARPESARGARLTTEVEAAAPEHRQTTEAQAARV